MATKTINWCTATQLDCGGTLPATAFVCVPGSIMAEVPTTTYGYIEATITGMRASTCADQCGACKWVYTIEYDSDQLSGSYVLVSAYINAVLCDNCLIEFIQSHGTATVDISEDEFNVLEDRVDGLWAPAQDGWIPANEDWEIDASDRITVPTDATVKYAEGDKIKVTDAGVEKIFSVVGVGATLLYLAGDTLLGAGPLTLPFYSHDSSVPGVADNFSWTPTVTAGGAMTVSATSVKEATYTVDRHEVHFQVTVTFTLGGVADTVVSLSLPITPTDSSTFTANAVRVLNSTGKLGSWNITGGLLQVTLDANWALGAGNKVSLQGFYIMG